MIDIETRMISVLKELKKNHHVIAVKAEFEAEGTRITEAVKLKNIVSAAGLAFSIKVGGCEAITDMYEALNLNVMSIIGPMIESKYAMYKFLNSAKQVFKSHPAVELFANIETKTAHQNMEEMFTLPEISSLTGIVIGRVDLLGSLGLARDDILKDHFCQKVYDICCRAKKKGLKVIVGGAVTIDSLPFFQTFPSSYIDRFETRKIVFECPKALTNTEVAFAKALEFELLWLKYKKGYYSSILNEDASRIEMLEKRYDYLKSLGLIMS